MNISKITMLALSLSMLLSTVLVSNDAYAGNGQVGGLPVPLDESAVFGEFAKQYLVWLIPAITVVGVGAVLIKRKY